MKIYHDGGKSHTLMVCPAALIKEAAPSDWLDEDGKPKRFDIVFDASGAATVDEKLGKLLVEKGYANKSPLKRVFNRLIH